MSDKAAITTIIVSFIAAILAFIGWVINVVHLFVMDAEAATTEFILSLVGVFIPFIGAIYGWIYVF